MNRRKLISIVLLLGCLVIFVLVLAIVLAKERRLSSCTDAPKMVILEVANKEIGEPGKLELRFKCNTPIFGFVTRFDGTHRTQRTVYPPNFTENGITGYSYRENGMCFVGINTTSVTLDEEESSYTASLTVPHDYCPGFHTLYISWGSMNPGNYTVNAPIITSPIPLDMSSMTALDVKVELKMIQPDANLHTEMTKARPMAFDPRAGLNFMANEFMFGKEASVMCYVYDWYANRVKSCSDSVSISTKHSASKSIQMNARLTNQVFTGRNPLFVCLSFAHSQTYANSKGKSISLYRNLCTETRINKQDKRDASAERAALLYWDGEVKSNDDGRKYVNFKKGGAINIACLFTGPFDHRPKIRINYKFGNEVELKPYFTYQGSRVHYVVALWRINSFTIGDRIVCSSPNIEWKDWAEINVTPEKDTILLFRNYSSLSWD
ncbi:uncharacterized protein LOC141908593 [Tubulanus polymorphus]|uniref:uncharacterized protein LOC141908593 n=1 Tax=Tubulanus polymorphus TaxID=672921 RepID=UPI003DA3551B